MALPNKRPAEPRKNPLNKLIGVVIVIGLVVLAVAIAMKIPDTVDLEKAMDDAAQSISVDSVARIAAALDEYPSAANKAAARQLGNELFRESIADLVRFSDYRGMEKLENALEDSRYKVFDTEENRSAVKTGWRALLANMQAEQDELERIKAVAARLTAANPPPLHDVRELADFPLPPGFLQEKAAVLSAAYSGAVINRNAELAQEIAAKAEDADQQAAVRAGSEETCRECAGRGSNPCQSCTRNPGQCPACSGTGKISSTRLDGNQRVTTEQPCGRCSGTGRCATCKGEGKVECFYCKGTAKRPNTVLAAENLKSIVDALNAKIDIRGAELQRLRQKHLNER